jgi:LAGLIDADG endonuclease
MELLIQYLGACQIYKYSTNQAVSLTIHKFSDLIILIIPFFEQNPLYGVKVLDYLDFCKVANLMKDVKHLTIEGLNLISTIKANMNRGRKRT